MQERILVYGGTGSGKSFAWLNIAQANPDSMFYCIDTDRAIDRMIHTEFKELSNLKIYNCRDWINSEIALRDIKTKAKETDWLVIDMVDALWDFVQSYYTQQVFNKNIDDYFVQLRKSISGGSQLEAFKGWTDWQVINKIYQDFINTVMYDLPCNIFVTAKATKYDNKEDEPLLKDSFSVVGFKPDGEKRNAYRVHTVLYLNRDSFAYYVTTVKDRGRQQLKSVIYSNFAELYNNVINNVIVSNKENSGEIITDDDIAYKAFGRWLESIHLRWSEAYKILGVDKIVNYKEAHDVIQKYLDSKNKEA